MSEIERTLNMHFNNQFVGKVNLWDDGSITATFEENENGAACVAYLVKHALENMLVQSGYTIGDFYINLN